MASTEDPAVINAYATATATRGLELEVKWVPSRSFSASFYALHQRTTYDPNAGGALLVDARTLGYQDVLDANGNVIYPAEAFLYGGRARIVLPDDMSEFDTKQRQSRNPARHERLLPVAERARRHVERQLFFEHLLRSAVRSRAAFRNGTQRRRVLGTTCMARSTRCSESQQRALVSCAQRRRARRSSRAGDARSALAADAAILLLARGCSGQKSRLCRRKLWSGRNRPYGTILPIR